MGESAQNFLTKFHNLPGDTVKEKQQNFYRLLREHHTLLSKSPEELDFVTANLKPNGHLQSIFRIEFLIYFHRFKELYQEVKNGDEITLSKIAKQQWFFQAVFKDRSPEDFVNEILPTLSHVVKLKILKRLPFDEQQSDQVFDALRKRYGIFLASGFLAKCSADKIRETLTTDPVKLTLSQLKQIYNKDPNLIDVYLEERSKHEGGKTFMTNNPIFKFIAQKNPEMFAKLFDKYEFEVNLGHRTTKRYIDSQRNDVLGGLESYCKILNSHSFVKRLGNDLKQIFFKENTKTSGLYWTNLIKHYPKKTRFSLYKTTYDSIYHHKFGENIDAITEDVLKLIPDPIEREILAKRKFEKEEDITYLRYVTPKYCFKEFTDKLNQMTVVDRIKYVEIATDCCVLNEDFDGLLKICELVSGRFKNDTARLKTDFFSSLFKDSKILDGLSEQHWKYLMEIIATADAKNEWVYNALKMRCWYVKFLINNDKPITEVLSKYNEWVDELKYQSEVWKNPKIQKKVLCELIEIGLVKAEEDHDWALYDCSLATACKIYNKKNPDDPINIFDNERIVKSMKTVLDKENNFNYNFTGIEYMICRKDTSEDLKEMKRLYFLSFSRFGDLASCVWFLKHEPKTILDNFDNFLDGVVEVWDFNYRTNSQKFWRLIKKYDFLQLDKKAVEHCIENIKDKSYGHKDKLYKILAMLATPDIYLDFIKSYIPTSAKVDLTDEDIKDNYQVQCQLVKFLSRVKSPRTVLPVALQFCKGDYLSFALGPLYSSIYRMAENETKQFIATIGEEKAVSFKKHAMHLSCVIYDQATVYDCLKNAKVPSLMATLKYFSKNPSDALWELAEAKIKEVDKNDLQLFKWSMCIPIPFRYKSKNFEAIWTVLDRCESNQLKKLLIQNIDKNVIKHLRSEFAFKIIAASIFKLEEANDFIASLFIHLSDDAKFEFLSKILAKQKSTWKCEKIERSSRHKLSKFVQSIFKIYMELEEPDPEFVVKFSATFDEHFAPSAAFEEFVLISLMKFKGESVENCAKALIELNHTVVEKWGRFVVNLLVTVNNCTIPTHLFKTKSELMKYCYFSYKFKETVDDDLLVIGLLPKSQPEDTEHYLLYHEVLTGLKQVNDETVQLLLNLYLKSEPAVEPVKTDFDSCVCCA